MTNPANTTDDGGLCQLIMHHTVRVDDMRFSVFGVCNTVLLVGAASTRSADSASITRSRIHTRMPPSGSSCSRMSPRRTLASECTGRRGEIFRVANGDAGSAFRVVLLLCVVRARRQLPPTEANSQHVQLTIWVAEDKVLVAPEYYVFTLFSASS